MRWWTELREILRGEITLRDLAPSGWRRRYLLAGLWSREAAVAARRADLGTLASALTYKTILSMVPVAAVAVAILSSVKDGAYTDMVVRYLTEQLQLGDALAGFIELIRQLAKNAIVVAGGGVVFFLWTVISLLTTIENAFGRVWQVERGRSWRRRLPAYITAMVLVPPFLVMSIWVTSVLGAWSTDGGGAWLGRFVMSGSAWGLTIIGMTAFYYLLPATRVKLAAAAYGGLFAGIGIEFAKWGFRIYANWSAANWRASTAAFEAAAASEAADGMVAAVGGSGLVGPLLALPLLLLWLWLVWSIVLGGAELSFVAQHFRRLAVHREMSRHGTAWKARAAAWALRIAAETWRRGDAPARMDEALAARAGLSEYQARAVLAELTDAGLLRRVAGVEEGYVPFRESTGLSLADAALAVRDAPLAVPDDAADPFDQWLRERFAAASAAERAALSSPDWATVIDARPTDGVSETNNAGASS